MPRLASLIGQQLTGLGIGQILEVLGPVNLLNNGNFASGLDSWTTQQGTFSVVAGQLVSGPTSNNSLTQPLTLDAGETYVASIQYILGSGSIPHLYIESADGSTELARVFLGNFGSLPANSYQLVSFTPSISAARANIFLDQSGITVDNVAVFKPVELLTNSSFDTDDFTDWTLNNTSGTATVVNGQAQLGSNDTISQTFSTQPSTAYGVIVRYPNTAFNSGITATDSATTTTLATRSVFFANNISLVFVATGTETTVTLNAFNAENVDSISVFEIPA